MTLTANIHEAKTHLSRLLARLVPVPVADKPARRQPGSAAGEVVIMPDFDAPLPEDIIRAYEG